MKEHSSITLSEHEIGSAYTKALRFVSISRRNISDQTRQYMADAIREFHDLLDARIESKRIARRAGRQRAGTSGGLADINVEFKR
jgi:hypothetical protein